MIPPEDVGYGIEGELQRGDDPEVAPAALEAPEQVGILLGTCAQKLAFRGDDVGLRNARRVQAVFASKPSEPATHRVADDADVGG